MNCLLLERHALYVGEYQIRVVTNKGDNQVGTNWLEERAYIAQQCYFDIKKF